MNLRYRGPAPLNGARGEPSGFSERRAALHREARSLAIASWAAFGVVLLLGESVVRLSLVAVAGIRNGLSISEWAVLVVASLFVGYVEGYRAFSRSFGPRVVERSFELARSATMLEVLFGPLYAMSLIGDTRKQMVRSWALVVAIVAMVVVVRRLPPTWRCIADASVALSLTWGIVVIASLWGARARSEIARAASLEARSSLPPGASGH